jgi:hypothetical protein
MKIPKYTKYSGIPILSSDPKSLAQIIKPELSGIAVRPKQPFEYLQTYLNY